MANGNHGVRPAADPAAETVDGVAAPTHAERNPGAPSHASDVVLAGDDATVGPGGDDTVPKPGWPRYSRPELGPFGDYDLLERLGEGGMGIVYRARQTAADRIVALKIVHTRHAGSHSEATRAKALERFRIEAQAAARLDHENIVPVYDVGQIGEQLYFAMRLVEGPSLNEVVRDGPLDARQAATYVLGATRGVAEAHRLGILHRDLKPHNVMLDRRSDRPLVADFGLAKVVEADDQVTRTGEVIGTPSYMPPEQISSASTVDARADVYALGATLYHLLVGRPPFQAANTLATMRQVLYQEPVDPQQLNPAIDADLNTICVTCLAKEPARRYATADALADDLRRYLDGQPIVARPIGRVERAVRWSRRNPAVAALSLLAIVLAAGVVAAAAIGYRNTAAALRQADRNLDVARASLNDYYTDVTEIDLEDAPGLQPLKRKLLARSLTYYQRLVEDNRAAGVTAELAANHFRVGVVMDQLGESRGAADHLRRAQQMQSQLLASAPDNGALRLALSDSWNELGRLAQRSGDLPAAAAAFRQAETLRAQLVAAQPDDAELARKLASVRMNQGLLAVRQQNFAEAAALYAEARAARQTLLERLERAPAADREGADARRLRAQLVEDLAKGSFNEGVLAAQQGRQGEAAAHFRQAVDRFGQLLTERPDSLKHRYRLGMAQAMLADALQLDGQVGEAASAFAAAQANLQVLVDDNPRVDDYQEQLTTLQISQAQFALRRGQQEARQALAAGAAAAGATAQSAASAASSQSYYEEARRTLLAAEARLRRLVEGNPQAVSHRRNLAATLQMLGDVELAFDDRAAARRRFESALQEADSLPPDDLNAGELRRAISESLQAVAGADKP